MSLEMLLNQFELVIQTPGDVESLEDKVHQLAALGHLTDQAVEASDTQSLIRSLDHDIQATSTRRRQSVVKLNKRDLDMIALPRLPDSWSWIALGRLGITQTGTTPSKKSPEYFDGPYPFVKPADISRYAVDYENESLSEIGYESGRQIPAGSVLMVCIGGSIGKVGLVDRDCSCNQQINAVLPLGGVLSRYVEIVLRSPYFQQQVISRAPKSTLPILSKGKWEKIPFPLAPLAEQKRIVAKVDELLAQTRALKAGLARQETTRSRWQRAATARLSNAPAAPERRAAWDHIAAHFDALYQTPDDIAALKQAILQLAVTGKLVPQDPGDEPAGVLLERVAAEKLRWTREGKITRTRNPLPMTADDVPFVLPNGWGVDRFANIADIASGVTKGRKFGNHKTVMLPYLRVANVQRGFLDLTEIKTIQVKEGELEKYRLKAGDLLLTEGGDADKLGRSTIWREEIADCIHQNHIFRARAFLSELRPEWFMLCTNSRYGRDYFLGAAKQTTNLASINMTQLSNFPMVLPPLPEQERIISKLNELNADIDAVSQRIEEAQAARIRVRSVLT